MGTTDRRFVLRMADVGSAVGVILGALHGVAAAQEVPLRRVHEMIPAPDRFSKVAGDWDADGDPDLASAGLSLLWLENVDHGRFEPRSVAGPDAHDPILAADLDLDGHSDLVTARRDPQSSSTFDLGIWIDSASGPFTSPPVVLPAPPGSYGFEDAAAGDVDDDGDVDLFAFDGFYSSSSAATPDTLFLNDGSGSFPAQGVSPPARTETWTAILADLDGDGDLDVLRADQDGTELWLNDGAGAFALAPAQPPVQAGSNPLFLRAADLNADGAIDFLTGVEPHLYLNSGEGRFTDEGSALPKLDYYFYRYFHIADLDGDELQDAAAVVDPYARGRYNNIGNVFFRNDGHGRFEADLTVELTEAINLVADVDSDHDLDLIGTSGPPGPTEAELWLNDGAGWFANSRDSWESSTEAEAVVAGDLDGDRFPDVLAWEETGTSGAPYPTILYRNLRNGTFREERLPFGLPRIPLRTSLADMDADGDLDVFSDGPSFGGSPSLLENDGSASFTDVSARLPSASPVYSSGFGDLDTDGDADLLMMDLGFTGPRQTPVIQGYSWLNDGSGSFTDSTKVLPSRNTYGGNALLGDVDGDHDLDSWILNASLLWLNDGTGGFSDATASLSGPYAGNEGAFADMDRDGDLDFLSKDASCFDGECYGSAHVLLNDGLGRFTIAPGYWDSFVPSAGLGQLSTADVDADGDIDALTGNCALWLNDGTGRLEDESYELSFCVFSYGSSYTTFFSELAIQDFDLDEDLDLWYPTFPRPVMSILRHLSRRSYPRAGKPLTMEVFGPPNTPWKLFAAEEFIAPQTTDFGYLRLPARGLRLIGSGMLDATGQAAITLGVPSDRALPGHTVYWQAFVGNPPRLTNLEFTTFSKL